MRVCFFSPVKDRALLQITQFYAQDIRALCSIADEVVLATRFDEVDSRADVHFVWWWTRAMEPLSKALAVGRPAIVTGVFDFANPFPGQGYASRPLIQRAAIRASLLCATHNLFVSRLEFDSVPRHLPTRSAHFAPLVVDCDLHSFAGAAREPFLLTIAWLNGDNPIRKGVDVAIRAHRQLLSDHPNLELRIAGSPGDGQAKLEKLVDELGTGERVRFLGRITDEQKVSLLQRCAAYLQTSVYEGFGVAAAEAMACGAPVIATRAGTLPEVLGPDAFFADRTEDSIADAVRAALRTDTQARRLRAAERIRVEFSFDRRRNAIRELIDEAVRERNPRRRALRALAGGLR
nr:D-inositol-3-phosphate glycosyltransferase [uncultured bacterium]